jgi:peptidoglycan-N-acetylglucosamine deacetylase
MTPRIPRLIAVIVAVGVCSAVPGCGWKKEGAGQDPRPKYKQEQAEMKMQSESIPVPSPAALQETAAEDAPALDLSSYPIAGPPLPDKVAYLTFDDGPSGHTDVILDILKQNGVKATFFVIGQESERAITLYKRMSEEGHKLGNHTFSHDYSKLYRNPDMFMQDVRKLEAFLQTHAGQKPDILRFPGGSNTRLGRKRGQAWLMPQMVKRVKAEGYQYFDWNVSSTDAAQAVQPKADIVANVLASAKGKDRAIVLMHDVTSKITTVQALPEVIEGLKKQGFRFDTLKKDSFTTQFLK